VVRGHTAVDLSVVALYDTSHDAETLSVLLNEKNEEQIPNSILMSLVAAKTSFMAVSGLGVKTALKQRDGSAFLLERSPNGWPS